MMYNSIAIRKNQSHFFHFFKAREKTESKIKRNIKKGNFGLHAVLILACFIICFPILYALIKASQEMSVVVTPSLKPGKYLFANIKTIFSSYNMAHYMVNSLVYAIIISVGKVLLSLLAATALVFYDFKGRRFVFGFIIVTLMLPVETLILGLFDIISLKPASSFSLLLKWLFNPKEFLLEPSKYGFGWGSSGLSIIFPFLASATGVFLFCQHFKTIPKSLADSVRIDGANSFQFLTHVLFPMSGNTIGALYLIQFVYVWNQYIWPRVIIRENSLQVVQIGLNSILSAGDSIQWNLVMCGSLCAMIPPLVVFALLYNAFMNGYALSSNK